MTALPRTRPEPAPDLSPEAALARLRAEVRAPGRLVVAFSGGVDSALLAFVAHEQLGEGVLAVTAVSPSLASSERAAARAFARAHGLRHVEVCTDEMERPEYAANAGDRCRHCKNALFDALEPLAGLLGAPLALGTNSSDLSDHRPGQAAAAERGVLAPLVAAGLSKRDVRAVAELLGLEVAAKPAAACLASRVAYGEPVSAAVLGRVEAAEEAVRALGFAELRVRSHGDGAVGRLEVGLADFARAAGLREELEAAITGAGFAFAALDLTGFGSGRMNVMLGLPALRGGR